MSKQITHYFCYVGHDTKAKNKLHQDFKDYLISMGGTLVEADKLKDLKSAILAVSREFNDSHKRCEPLELKFWETHKSNWAISGFYCQTFYIIPAYLTQSI